MKKEISSRTIAQIKTLFKSNEADYVKVDRLNEKIAVMTAERDSIMEGINMIEARVKAITKQYSGVEYTSAELIDVVVTPLTNEDGTPKLDEKGYQMKKKQYVQKYPDFFPVSSSAAASDAISHINAPVADDAPFAEPQEENVVDNVEVF